MPYRVPPGVDDRPRRELPTETYVIGTLACALGVASVWMMSLRLYEYAAGNLIATAAIAYAAHVFADRR